MYKHCGRKRTSLPCTQVCRSICSVLIQTDIVYKNINVRLYFIGICVQAKRPCGVSAKKREKEDFFAPLSPTATTSSTFESCRSTETGLSDVVLHSDLSTSRKCRSSKCLLCENVIQKTKHTSALKQQVLFICIAFAEQ